MTCFVEPNVKLFNLCYSTRELRDIMSIKLKRSQVILGVIIIGILIVGIFTLTHNKTESKLVSNQTSNLEVENVVGVYIQEGEDYTKVDTIPEEGYTLNQEKSYCKVGDSDINANINYDPNTKTLSISPLTTKGTKCYLYFDEISGNTMQEIIADYTIGNRGSFSSVYTTSTTNTVFQTTDWEGTSYYFAGAPTDNWVYFGGFYWRIVRVNGDGSVRLIYNGTGTTTTGATTVINNGQVFNSSRDRSEYVGLKYTTGQQHGQATDSPILDTLQSWYTSSGLSVSTYSQYIDTNVGFCSDRNMEGGLSWSSRPSSTIYYAAIERLNRNKNPNLACTISDIIVEPVGLITADEVALAGGVEGIANQSYYLYNNQYYWTMSPSHFDVSGGNISSIFSVGKNGALYVNHVDYSYGTRPVINLKADTNFIGEGTVNSPYEVAA